MPFTIRRNLCLMDDNLEKIQLENESLQKLIQQRDEDCENYVKRINDLEIGIQQSQKDPEEYNVFQVEQVKYIKDKFGELYSQHKELQKRYFAMLAKKNDYKRKYLVLAEKQKSSADIGSESNNHNLSNKIADLESQIEALKQFNKTENERANNFQSMYEKSIADFEVFRSKSADSFQILRSKIYEAREGKDYEELQNENETLKTAIDELTESAKQMAAQNEIFINSLAAALGCQSLDEITESVQKLVPLKIQNESLKLEIDNLKKLGSIDQNEAYSSITDSLRQIQETLSPDNLNLDSNSPLRQLFAAFSNMLDAAISPNASKVILQPHIRALKQQARAFKKEDSLTNSALFNYGNINSSLNASDNKTESSRFTNIKQDSKMSFSPIPPQNAGDQSQIVLPSMKSDV